MTSVLILWSGGATAQEIAADAPVPMAPPIADTPLNPDRLWLPHSYVKYLPNLQQIAAMQLASERCIEVVRGELLLSESQLEQPVFAIMCRDSARLTYVQKFDGLALDSYEQAIIRPPEPEVIEESVEVEPEPEPEPEPDIAVSIYEHCKVQWQSDVKLMLALLWLDDIEQLEPVLHDGETPETQSIRFERRFNARNAAGVPLRYVAVCEATDPASVQTRIDIRRD